MPIPFVHRAPTRNEVERFRLILSTYQDGTGQLELKGAKGSELPTLPGWRDFERSVALAFGGRAQESKFVFDVLLPDMDRKDIYYGLSCKMRRALDQVDRTGRVTIELSNSAGEFWRQLAKVGLNQRNYRSNAGTVGDILLSTVKGWHYAVSLKSGGSVDTSKSYYLVLSWNRKGWYQLHQFPLQLPRAKALRWDFPPRNEGGRKAVGRRVVGHVRTGVLFEWYGESGGQLKYYPETRAAIWSSEEFRLEPLPPGGEMGYGILSKAAVYFPDQWKSIST